MHTLYWLLTDRRGGGPSACCAPERPDQPRQTEMEYQDEADDAHTGAHSMNLDQDILKKCGINAGEKCKT